MNWPHVAWVVVATAVGLMVMSCSDQPQVDWAAPENFFAVEKSTGTDDGARLEFHSLMDAPPLQVYAALADAEHFADFVDGVSASELISTDGHRKVTRITQTVIGRQSRAEVKWTLHPEKMKIEFETLKSDANYNDGRYWVIPSPDGKRSYVISVFDVKWKGAPPNVPIGVLTTATRESFGKAAASVKQRAVKAAT